MAHYDGSGEGGPGHDPFECSCSMHQFWCVVRALWPIIMHIHVHGKMSLQYCNKLILR